MKILIVENEVYLAQSISAKLVDHNCKCEIATTVKDAIKNEKYDAVLLSTSMNGQNFMSVVEHHKNSIIILMVSYVNNDTVSAPLKAGAKDYIMKPFIMDELINKIKHYSEFDKIKQENEFLKEFLRDIFYGITTPEVAKKIELPTLILSPSKKHADAYAYRLALAKSMTIKSMRVENIVDFKTIKNANPNILYYLHEFDMLKKAEKQSFLDSIQGSNCVVYSSCDDSEWPYGVVQIESSDSPLGSGDILAVEEYVRSVLEQFQDKYPDIELAKKLGISRKSLWEKRKKHGINKKK